MTNRYARAYTEVLEILNHFSDEEYSKIPAEKIEFYKKHMDKNYIYSVNPKMDLSEQNISTEAKAILVSLFRDYFATEKQKQTLEKILSQNQEEMEKTKREKYNVDDIFKTTKMEENNTAVLNNEIRVANDKETIFTKIAKFIKQLLNRKNI